LDLIYNREGISVWKKVWKKINIILFGKPGAGKNTNFLKENYNLKHLSTGDIFRLNIKNNND
jgi:dephospho-CoA kinase